MELHDTIRSFREAVDGARAQSNTVGFVPTMGALHAGHMSLVERASRECDVVAMSIFVNPLQFAANEDLGRYPRPFEDDRRAAEQAGVAHLFAPPVEEMYPDGSLRTSVRVSGVSEVLEGAFRPGHFDGVSTVVGKLFAIVGRCRAYFGEKDWQQLEVVRRMVRDLSFPIDVVGCPIVREEDGLAMSSRNIYLSSDERRSALLLNQALRAGLRCYADGERKPGVVCDAMANVLSRDPAVQTQYAAHVGADMSSTDLIERGDRLLVAAHVGRTRLIDNLEVA